MGRNSEAAERTKQTRTSPADVIMWSGCKDSQTSADTNEAGRATGAMSYVSETFVETSGISGCARFHSSCPHFPIVIEISSLLLFPARLVRRVWSGLIAHQAALQFQIWVHYTSGSGQTRGCHKLTPTGLHRSAQQIPPTVLCPATQHHPRRAQGSIRPKATVVSQSS